MTTLSPTLNGRGAFSVCSEVLPQRLKESSNTHDFRTLRPPSNRWFFFYIKMEIKMSNLTMLRKLAIEASANTKQAKNIDVAPSVVKGTVKGAKQLHSAQDEKQTFTETQHSSDNILYDNQYNSSSPSIFFYILILFIIGYFIYSKIFKQLNKQNNKISKCYTESKQSEKNNQTMQTFYKNGNLQSEAVFSNGKMSGELRVYFENGKIEAISNYKDDNKNGEETIFYENGQIKYQGSYIKGKKEGVFKKYLPDGTLESETMYSDGVFSEKKLYVEDISENNSNTVTKKYFGLYNSAFGSLFSLSGRMNRLHFFIYYVLYTLAFTSCVLVFAKSINITESSIFFVIFIRFFILLPLISKRFHDLNISIVFYIIYSAVSFFVALTCDEYLLLTVEMLIKGIDSAITLFLLFKKGSIGDNKYGISPLNN